MKAGQVAYLGGVYPVLSLRHTSVALLLLVALSGCGGRQATMSVPALHTKFVKRESGHSAQEKNWIEKNVVKGMPVLGPAAVVGRTKVIAREGYVLQHSALFKIPLWVSEGVPESQLSGNSDRGNSAFLSDPVLKKGSRAELTDYKGSGFDRGHQAPAADFKSSQKLTDESFYLSNMAPQVGAGFNRDIWQHLEGWARDVVKERKHAYIITGPLFLDSEEESEENADGNVEVETIGTNNVAVPTHFFKIMVAQGPEGKIEAIAFVMENKKFARPPKGQKYDFREFIKAIDWIEDRTDLNFMPDLSPLEEERLERKASEMWE